MRVEGAGSTHRLKTPNVTQEFFLGEDPVGFRRKGREERKLLIGQIDITFPDLDPSSHRIDREFSNPKRP